MATSITIRTQGVLLDAVLAAKYDPATARALLVPTLDLNPGLAALGPVLPLGTVVVIPDRPTTARAQRKVVDLFGG